MKCYNILKGVVSEVKLRKNVSRKACEARPSIFSSKYHNGSARALFPSSLVVGRNKGRDQGGELPPMFQCLQCVRVAIINQPAMVT